MAGLLRLLGSDELPRREAAVAALATLTADNPDVISRIACSGETTKQLLQLLKSPSAAVRFLASQCLTNLAPALPSTSEVASQSGQVRSAFAHLPADTIAASPGHASLAAWISVQATLHSINDMLMCFYKERWRWVCRL